MTTWATLYRSLSFHCRFAEEGVEQDMERHRVTELFGAAGNLHMTVFEILFKHAYITRLPTLLGLESGLESFREATRKKRPASYAKTRFTRFKRLFERAFSQLLELQMHQGPFTFDVRHVPLSENSHNLLHRALPLNSDLNANVLCECCPTRTTPCSRRDKK